MRAVVVICVLFFVAFAAALGSDLAFGVTIVTSTDFIPTVECPADFVYAYGGCYQLTAAALTWPDAVMACENQSAYLAAPRSEVEFRWILQLFTFAGVQSVTDDVWLGVNDITTEGVWRSVDAATNGGYDGETAAIAYARWYYNQPDNGNGVENCAAMRMQGTSAGLWWDFQCSSVLQGLCRYNATVTPKSEGRWCNVLIVWFTCGVPIIVSA